MQSCTECGTPISPAVGPPVLLNGKVVCQPCWQKSEAESAAPAASTRPTTQPSSRMTSSRRATSSAAPAPARRQTSTTPAARRSSSREAAPATPPAASRSARATSSRRNTTETGDMPPPRATSRTATLIEEVESSTSGERMKLYIIITMCVMVLAAGISWYLWHSKTTREAQDAKQAETEANAAAEHVRNVIKKDPNDFAAIRKAVEDAEQKVKGFPPLRNEISNAKSENINNEQNAQSKAANTKLLDDLRKDIEDPAKRANVRVNLDRARAVGNNMDKAYQEEVTKLGQKLTLYALKEGVDAAKAKEAAGDLTGALAAYDDAVIKFNKQFDADGGRAATPEILNLYKELIVESDKLVERVETPEYEGGIPERDMLSAKERGAWGKTEGSIELSWTGRELEIKGIDTGKKITGVADLGLSRTSPWSDVVMDINFTIVSGRFEMFLRYWPSKPNFLLNFTPPEYELNKAYQMTIRIKGSKVEMIQPDQNPQTDVMKPAVSRTGGIGFALNPGAKIIISSCKVKVLRPKA